MSALIDLLENPTESPMDAPSLRPSDYPVVARFPEHREIRPIDRQYRSFSFSKAYRESSSLGDGCVMIERLRWRACVWALKHTLQFVLGENENRGICKDKYWPDSRQERR